MIYIALPSKENTDYLFLLGMCDACTNKLEANLVLLDDTEKTLNKINGVTESSSNVPFTDDSDDEHGDGDGSRGNGGGGGPPSVSSSDSTTTPNDSKATLTVDKTDKSDVKDDDMTFDVMLAAVTAVFSCKSKSGLVNIHGHEYTFSACPKHISGRGGGTIIINTEFSKPISELFVL